MATDLDVEVRIASDPQDRPLVAGLVEAALKRPDPDVTAADVAALRADNPRRLGGPLIRRLADGAKFEAAEVGGMNGEWITVAGGSDKVTFLYFHGGAYVRGSLFQGRGIASALAMACAGRTFAVDYRQAPEHVFPAPIEDGVRAYRGLLASGVDPRSVVLAGDSCGGAIVVSVMLVLRDAGVPLPAGAVSISPWADLTMSGASWQTNAEKDTIGFRFETSLASIYLGGPNAPDPLASPVFAHLHGLSPLLVITGAHERLYSDARSLASAGVRAGVQTSLRTYEGMVHVFPMLALRTGDMAIRDAAAFAIDVTRR